MKRIALVLPLIMALLFSAVVGTLFVGLAKANMIFYGYFPTAPDTSPLIVTAQSPTQNQTCNSTSVWLNFTVTKPETWLRLTDSRIDKYMIIGKVTSAYYCLDGAERQGVPGTYSEFIFEEGILSELSRTMDFSVNLSLPQGTHNVTVSAEGESYHVEHVGAAGGHSTVKVYGSSETVTFTVAEPLPPEPPATFPTEIVMAASGASAITLLGVGLLVYFRKRHR